MDVVGAEMHERKGKVDGRGAAVYTAEDSGVGGDSEFVNGEREGRMDGCDSILKSEPGLGIDAVF